MGWVTLGEMGNPLLLKNLRKMFAILIIEEGLVCLVSDENRNFA